MENFSDEEALVLNTIKQLGRATGYQIRKEMGFGMSKAYPILYRLEGKGYVNSDEEEVDLPEGKRFRRFYSIAGMGTMALEDYLMSLQPTNQNLAFGQAY